MSHKFNFKPQSRRGISSVVGALFFTVLMVAGFSVLSLALDAQTDIVSTQRIVSDIQIKKQQERFGIAVSTDVNNLLNISVSNLGQNPVGIESFWIINKTLAMEPATRYEINYDDSFVTGGSPTQILTSQPLYMIPDTYDIKVISSLGTIEIAELVVSSDGSSSNSLQSVLLANPPDVILGQNVTLAMIVTNVGELTIKDVTPSTPSITPSASIVTPLPSNPQSVDLLSGESIVFVWDYQTNAAAAMDSDIDFLNFAEGVDENKNTVKSNMATDTSILREDATDGSSTEPPIFLTQDLLSRPEMFMIIPGPFGDGPEKAIWGMNVVNPTGQDMYVSKVVITLLSPRSNSLDRVFSASAGVEYCDPEAISPTPDNWVCPENNNLVWSNISNPVKIPPYSVYPFLAKVHADRLSGGSDSLEAIVVNGNVFTTFGEFSKSGYSTSMDNAGNSYVNVYLSDIPHSTSNANIKVNQTSTSATVQQFNVVVADFQIGGTEIDESSKLIINMPKGWVVDPDTITGFDNFVWDYYSFGDTSSQISADFTSNLIDGGRTIQFDATAPTVTNEQMYVMYVLADGKTTGSNFSLSSFSEIVLKVVP
jgi:hypothetical protein